GGETGKHFAERGRILARNRVRVGLVLLLDVDEHEGRIEPLDHARERTRLIARGLDGVDVLPERELEPCPLAGTLRLVELGIGQEPVVSAIQRFEGDVVEPGRAGAPAEIVETGQTRRSRSVLRPVPEASRWLHFSSFRSRRGPANSTPAGPRVATGRSLHFDPATNDLSDCLGSLEMH